MAFSLRFLRRVTAGESSLSSSSSSSMESALRFDDGATGRVAGAGAVTTVSDVVGVVGVALEVRRRFEDEGCGAEGC